MSETPKRKRAWFQYHLSTAVVVMFAAAGLLWLNIGLHEYQLYGWPFHAFGYYFWDFDDVLQRYEVRPTDNDWFWAGLDAIIALLLLGAIAIACEARTTGQKRPLHPATRIILICFCGVCALWNRAEPLCWYFLEQPGAPLVARILGWEMLAFAVAFICECLAPLGFKAVAVVFLTPLACLLFMALLVTTSGRWSGSRSNPRIMMLLGIRSALDRYKIDHGSYPPEPTMQLGSGAILYAYLCKPLPPTGEPFLDPPSEYVHRRRDGVTELRAPYGIRYVYTTRPKGKSGELEAVVEEISPFPSLIRPGTRRWDSTEHRQKRDSDQSGAKKP